MGLQDFSAWLQATPFSVAIQSSSWLIPALQSLHILMVGVVFISILVVALRVLGRMRVEEPLPQVWARFAPFFWTGVIVMAVTGILLTISEPVREFLALSYRLKMLLLVVAIGSAMAFSRRVRAAATTDAPGLRLAAVGTIVLWLAIIFLGRAIAYDDSVWGSWSPAVLQRGGEL